MNLEFKSLKDLYYRINPALLSKKAELKKLGYYYITENDIWNYLTQIKWKTSENLSLSDMVEDIFNLNPNDINNFVIKKVSKEMREPHFDE